MTKKIFIVGDEDAKEMFGLLAMVAGLIGLDVKMGTGTLKEVKAGETGEFDVNQFVKPWIPKVAVAYAPSVSAPGQSHCIRKDKDGNLYCDCKGFTYRGTCRHVDKFVADQKRKEMPKTFPAGGITVRRFNSRSQRGVIYDVKLHNEGFVCTCPGFNFHGTCKHVVNVRRSINFPGSI